MYANSWVGARLLGTKTVKLKRVTLCDQSGYSQVLKIGVGIPGRVCSFKPPTLRSRLTASMTTATAAAAEAEATVVASTAKGPKTHGTEDDKKPPRTYSGRPNPLNVAYEQKLTVVDKRIADARARLVSIN